MSDLRVTAHSNPPDYHPFLFSTLFRGASSTSARCHCTPQPPPQPPCVSLPHPAIGPSVCFTFRAPFLMQIPQKESLAFRAVLAQLSCRLVDPPRANTIGGGGNMCRLLHLRSSWGTRKIVSLHSYPDTCFGPRRIRGRSRPATTGAPRHP